MSYRGCLSVLLAVAVVGEANAVPVADVAIQTIAAEADGQFVYGEANAQLGRSTASASWADGVLSFSHGRYPFVAATASFAGSARAPNYVTQGIATLEYFFTIVGEGEGPVPIRVAGLSNLLTQSDGGALSSWDIFDNEGTRVGGDHYACTPSEVSGCGFTTFSELSEFRSYRADSGLFSGIIRIQALADAYVSENPNSAYAYIDPYISIDDSFLSSHPGYSVLVSPGIGNSPIQSVPGPAGGSLFLIGVVGAIAQSRRKAITRADA